MVEGAHAAIGSVAFFSHAFSDSSKCEARMSVHCEWYEFSQSNSSGVKRLKSINFL